MEACILWWQTGEGKGRGVTCVLFKGCCRRCVCFEVDYKTGSAVLSLSFSLSSVSDWCGSLVTISSTHKRFAFKLFWRGVMFSSCILDFKLDVLVRRMQAEQQFICWFWVLPRSLESFTSCKEASDRSVCRNSVFFSQYRTRTKIKTCTRLRRHKRT